ncbi:MAG: uroporphyrinogen-III C-methyltransferase [Ekhidna sp.]|nr:uroporphyrinogen-III C-methyltransferase [Ekhidna sp.]MBC6426134.1 uroporphyrinogen-III C-methyltransferase [Ekhidna sp.]
MRKPKFTLVGAGPGDPDLITIKGVKALTDARVVLYDSLLDKRLLAYAPKARKIFVGKRKGVKAYAQEEIHELIVKWAFADGHVVRLKGGDPFVFGRGSEEIDYVASFGIEIALVPGITSSTAVPASLGIAVTQRRIAESFWVITGTTSERQLSDDLLQAARTSATVVVLMGFGKLEEIVHIYKSLGRGTTPVAVIQNGTMENERKAVGIVDTIVNEVQVSQVATPAVIVLGEVVRHSQKLKNVFAELKAKEALQMA